MRTGWHLAVTNFYLTCGRHFDAVAHASAKCAFPPVSPGKEGPVVTVRISGRRPVVAHLRPYGLFPGPCAQKNAKLAHLGVVRRQARDFKGAYASIKQALDILHEAYGPDPHELIRALTGLGLLQRRKITSYLISRALASRIMRPVPEEKQLKPAA